MIGLVKKIFSLEIAPDLSEEGIAEFFSYAGEESLMSRLKASAFVMVAADGDEIVGMLEMCALDHVALFFVDSRCRGCGIGRRLLELAVSASLEEDPDIRDITVNAALPALAVYRALGFDSTGPETIRNGIRFVPMRLALRFSRSAG